MYLPLIPLTEQTFIKQWVKDFHKWHNKPRLLAFETYQHDSSDPIDRSSFTRFLRLLSINRTAYRYNGKLVTTYRKYPYRWLTPDQTKALCAPPQATIRHQPKPLGRPKSIKPTIPLSEIKLTEL